MPSSAAPAPFLTRPIPFRPLFRSSSRQTWTTRCSRSTARALPKGELQRVSCLFRFANQRTAPLPPLCRFAPPSPSLLLTPSLVAHHRCAAIRYMLRSAEKEQMEAQPGVPAEAAPGSARKKSGKNLGKSRWRRLRKVSTSIEGASG